MRKLAGLLLVLATLTCSDREPTAPEPSAPRAEISDALHQSGNAHFFLLPPLVSAPTFNGTFDPTLSPVVRICEWTSAGCGALVAEFTDGSGPGSETVRVDVENELYIVNWHTDQSNLDPAKTYRILVLVAGTELGFADVDVVSSGRELKDVQSGNLIALPDGTTLPIKFRIEEGALGIVIDATALSAPEFRVTGLEGSYPTSRPLASHLAPGHYTIFYQTAGGCTPLTGPCVAFAQADFAVKSDGTLDFDPSLDGILAGRGMRTLTVNGVTLNVDFRGLSAPTVGIGGLQGYLGRGGQPFTTDQVYTLALLPGLHPIFYQTAGGCTPVTGPCVAFTDAFFMAAVNGSVDYDAALDGILAGRGTSTLTVKGLTVNVDVSGLSAPTVGIGGLQGYLGGGGQPFTTDRVYTLTLLPGLHPIFYQTAGGCTPVTGPCVAFTDAFFMVAVNGSVDYAATLDGILAGRGTSTLTVKGLTVNVDVRGLSTPTVGIGGLQGYLDGGAQPFTTDRVYTLTLLPGLHPLFYQTSGSPTTHTDAFFSVAVNGSIDFDPSLDGILIGRGTTTLTVDGADIAIDATDLEETTFTLGGVGDFATGGLQDLKLLPGPHRFSTSGDEDFFFNVLVGETVDFDASFDSFVSGRGSGKLTVKEP